MFGSIKTVGKLREFLNRQVLAYNTLVADYTASMQADVDTAKNKDLGVTFAGQQYWLAWHSTELAVAVVAANIAASLLNHLKDAGDDDLIPDGIKKMALDEVVKEMQITSRSTSPAGNLAEDATRAFWSELAGRILKD